MKNLEPALYFFGWSVCLAFCHKYPSSQAVCTLPPKSSLKQPWNLVRPWHLQVDAMQTIIQDMAQHAGDLQGEVEKTTWQMSLVDETLMDVQHDSEELQQENSTLRGQLGNTQDALLLMSCALQAHQEAGRTHV